jgi:hypothetical protein
VRGLLAQPAPAKVIEMALLVIVLVIAICSVPLGTAIIVLRHRTLAIAYACSALIAGVAAYDATFSYEYYPNSNTRFLGWPVPYIIFQRERPDAPWTDFVGWQMLGAFPVNMALFLFVPSMVILVLARRRTKKLLQSAVPWKRPTDRQ